MGQKRESDPAASGDKRAQQRDSKGRFAQNDRLQGAPDRDSARDHGDDVAPSADTPDDRKH